MLALTICVSSVNLGSAQTLKDSVLMEQSKILAINSFKQGINENALIYSGNEYVEFISIESMHQIIKGTPFFIMDSLVLGKVEYSDIIYELPLKFQLIEQKIIINHPITKTPIELLNERVNFFSIGLHHFFKTPPEVANLLSTKQIYAELLFNGSFKLWVLHDKILKPNKRAEDQTATYINFDQYIIQQNDKYFKIKSEQDVLHFCLDKKIQIQEFIQIEGKDFNKNFESAILQVLKYYSSIPH